MFIVNKETIEKRFSDANWKKNLERLQSIAASVHEKIEKDDSPMSICEKTEKAMSELSNTDKVFMDNYSEIMINGMQYILDNGDDLNAYIRLKVIMQLSNMTPEEFERGVFNHVYLSDNKLLDNVNQACDIDLDALSSFGYIPAFTKIISKKPLTIIYFADGSKVVVTEDENFDEKTGIYIALLKKAMGSKNLQNLFKLIENDKIYMTEKDTAKE